jgi:phosphoribosylamine---glycine ligase
LLAAAESIDADLTVVGPEAPLVAGVVDVFRAAGRKIVGPNREAAQLEGSKIFAKNFLEQRNIPTAAFVTVENEADARKALDRFGFPVVLKADGLAAGKGVVVAQDRAQAEEALATLHRPAGDRRIPARRGSQLHRPLRRPRRGAAGPTQDHKAVFDGDTGPNTGGMGAYCDAAILTDRQAEDILNRVIYPTVEATGFTGFLYAGMMMTADGPKVLEFNVRLGDPETQPLMHRMSCDFVPALMAAAEGRLAGTHLEWRAGPSVCVVMASAGYPGAYESGKAIGGIADAEARGAVVFQAGTRLGEHGLETAGGRVLGVTASGDDLAAAIGRAYQGVEAIHFDGAHFRRDIGRKGLARYRKENAG